MKQRRICVLPEATGEGATDDGGGTSTDSCPVGATPTTDRLPRSSSPLNRWADAESKDEFVRARLRRLLLIGEPVEAPSDDRRIDLPPNRSVMVQNAVRSELRIGDDDDNDCGGGCGCDLELVYDTLCRDAGPKLYRLALHSKDVRLVKDFAAADARVSAVQYRVTVDALLRSARRPTLVALDGYVIARLAARRQTPVPDEPRTPRIAAIPTACLQLAVVYLPNPWRLAAVCRRWHALVQDGPLHLSHQLAHALRRLEATTEARAALPKTDRALLDGDSDSDSDGGGGGDRTVREKMHTEFEQTDQVAHAIAVRIAMTRFRARAVCVFLPAPAFRSVATVARLVASLSRLQRLTVALRVDNRHGRDPTAPLDALDSLPRLDTLRLTLEHECTAPAEFRMHVPRLPSLTRLECRVRAIRSRIGHGVRDTIPTLDIRCQSLRVLRLRTRSEAGAPRPALPHIEWERAQSLEELSLDFDGAENFSGREYERIFWLQCVDLDTTSYERQCLRGFADALRSDAVADSRCPPTRFARSMQRLRRLEIDGTFTVPPHLAALDAVRIRTHAHRQDAAWSTLVSLRSIACRVDPMADAVKFARYAPPSVTHVDLDARTLRRTTAAEFAAVREFAARLKAAGGALTWNGGVAACPEFRVTDDVQQLRVGGGGGDDDDEFPNADDDEFSDDSEDAGLETRASPRSIASTSANT